MDTLKLNNLQVLENLASRYFYSNLQDKVNMSIGEGKVTFPLYEFFTGKLVGIHNYNPLGDKEISNNEDLSRYFTGSNRENSAYTVGFIELINTFPDSPIFVTEGLFDAVRVAGMFDVCCLFSCGVPSREKAKYLNSISQVTKRPLVWLADPNLSSDINRAIYRVTSLVIHPENYGIFNDLGSMTDDEVETMMWQTINYLSKVL
jgi:hypothetical protein